MVSFPALFWVNLTLGSGRHSQSVCTIKTTCNNVHLKLKILRSKAYVITKRKKKLSRALKSMCSWQSRSISMIGFTKYKKRHNNFWVGLLWTTQTNNHFHQNWFCRLGFEFQGQIWYKIHKNVWFYLQSSDLKLL